MWSRVLDDVVRKAEGKPTINQRWLEHDKLVEKFNKDFYGN